MIPAQNQSGFAPDGTVEVELGTLNRGDAFRSYGYHGGVQEGVVVARGECSVRVEVEGDASPREFQALNEETGEYETKVISRSGKHEENWGPGAAVEYVEAGTRVGEA